MSRINPTNPLLGNLEKFEQSDSHIRQWESSRVEWTMRRLKLERQRKEVLSAAIGGQYTFAEFNRVVNFPMYLLAEAMTDLPCIHRDPKSRHPLWFTAFRSLPFVKLYEQRFEELPQIYQQQPIGMVFPRKGFSQGLILHNGDWDLFVPPQSSCHVLKGGKKHSMNLVVQPYTGFIDHVRQGLAWGP